MEFLPNTDKKDIFNAIIAGQRSVMIDNIEVFLKPLKRDTLKNREKEADIMATELVKLL